MNRIKMFRFTKRISLALIAITAVVSAVVLSCKKPTDGVQVVINSSILKYTMLVTFVDASDGTTVPPGLVVKISGQDAGNVYNLLGQKDFTVGKGQLDIGLHPNLVPTAARPVTFNLEVSATGYMPISQPVVVQAGQTYQSLKISLLNLTKPPSGLSVVSLQVDASSGALTTQQAVKIGTGTTSQNVETDAVNTKTTNSVGDKAANDVYYDNAVTSVVLPAGTSFYYYTYGVTDTVVGTRRIPVYGDPTVISSGTSSANVSSPPFGVNVSTAGSSSGSGAVSIIYTPIVSYYEEEYKYYKYGYTKHKYTGKVNVVVLYTKGTSTNASLFPDLDYTPNSIKLLNGTTVTEDNLLFTSAVKQSLSNIYFIGTVNGQQTTISPDATSSWTTSYLLDPNTINPATKKPIAAGDSIEIGIDYEHNQTIHAGIVKTTNGQLRLQSQSTNGGYYYKGTYVTNYNYNFNTAADTTVIPDLENLTGYYTIDCGTAGVYSRSYYPNEGVIKESGKIVSAQSITPTATFYSSYFDKRLTATVGSGSTAAVFSGWSGLQPLTTFDVSLICNGSKAIKPTFAANVTSPVNGPFTFKAVNGHWATRGLTPGQTISYTVTFSKGTVTFSKNSIAAGENAATITYTGGNNSFCSL